MSKLLGLSEKFIKQAKNGGYTESYIPKSSGGKRKIEEPDPELKSFQEKLIWLFRAKDLFKPSYFSHAFMQGRI